MERVPALDELRKLRVVDLKERLSNLGLPQGGLKADLISRLHAALVDKAKSPDEDLAGEEEEEEEEGEEMEYLEREDSQSSPLALNYTDDAADLRREEEGLRLQLEEERRRQNEMIRLAQKREEEERLRREEEEEEERVKAEAERQRLEELRLRQEEEAEKARLEEERRREEEKLRLKLVEERRRQEEEMQRARLEEERRRQEEEEARLKMEEEQRRKVEEEMRLKFEEERRQHEERLRLKVEEERRQEEEKLRQRAEEERRQKELKETEELRIRLEEERRKQDEELRVQLEEERRQREEDEKRKQEEELRLRQEEELRLRRKEEERIRREEERLRQKQEEEEMLRRKEEDERVRREEERLRQKQEEEEMLRRKEEVERLRQKEEEEMLRQKEEDERIRREEETMRQKQEEEEMLRKKQEEMLRKKQEEEMLRKKQEEEMLRKKQDEEMLRKKQDEEMLRKKQDEEMLRKKQEEEMLRKKHEEERIKHEEQRMRQKQEEERLRQRQEEERLRQRQEEERLRQRQEEERLRQKREEAERMRQKQEEEKRKQKDEEENRRKQEILIRQQEEAKRKEAELFRLQQGALIEQKMEEEEKRIQQQTLILHQQQEENMMREQIKLLGAEGERMQQQHQLQATAATQHIISITSTSQQQLQPVIVSPATTTNVTVVPVIQAPSIQTMVVPLVTGVTPTTLVTQTIVHAPQTIPRLADGNVNRAQVLVVPAQQARMIPTTGFQPGIPNQQLGPPMAFVGSDDRPPGLGEDEMAEEYVVPQALERVLALGGNGPQGTRRVLGPQRPPPQQQQEMINRMDTETVEANKKTSQEPKQSKNVRKKAKKKKRRARNRELGTRAEFMEDEAAEPDVEVEYVQASLEMDIMDPMYGHFMSVFEAFKLTDPNDKSDEKKPEEKKEPDLRKKPKDADEELEEEPRKEGHQKLSKRKLKKLSRLSVAELKQHVSRPDVVEMHDVTAKDPRVLVLLKAYRNTVPVPRHWCFKRKYLQGKRGIEKPPFDLPDFIKKTGIMEMRQALIDKEGHMTMKAKMRERVRPTMGKIDIDYQKLHDAFFKWQTKPRMTIHGDLYYEGKEFETRLKEKKPGDLSDELRTALGMPVGPNAQKVPPPWLIAMQRYGPPPSYPNLKIPGLNAPIPDSCSFGYHAGGWGKPPVDEGGRPLYGDVFGTQGYDYQTPHMEEEVDRTLWGELESESESESELEEESEEEEEEEPDRGGMMTPAEGGLVTPSGLTSIPTGMETPDMIELRKRKIETDMEGVDTPALYTVLPEKKTERMGISMMGSTHVYDVNAAIPAARNRAFGSAMEAGVEVTLDPSELDMDSAAMAARYEQTLREQNQLAKEDLSDMVAEHAAKQKHKRKRQQQQDTGKTAKKYKDFKF